MTRISALLDRNEQFANAYSPEELGLPATRTIILSCLDHRVDPAITLGLRLGDAPIIRNAGGRVTQAVIDDIAYLTYLVEQLIGREITPEARPEVAVIQHTQCGTALLADPAFRHRAAEATQVAEATLEASVVADPHLTVKLDVDRLLTAPELAGKVIVSGHVYDIETGRITTIVDTRD
ncbi:MAG TPA: carbonic anhydrase [Pseudonocardiaceae bacterium]|nr:carbonic anhydrase [Pseudonocardiaceae bacterium]